MENYNQNIQAPKHKVHAHLMECLKKDKTAKKKLFATGICGELTMYKILNDPSRDVSAYQWEFLRFFSTYNIGIESIEDLYEPISIAPAPIKRRSRLVRG